MKIPSIQYEDIVHLLHKYLHPSLKEKSMVMSIAVFLFVSISTIITLDQVQHRQITNSQAQASQDTQPGGVCDGSVNKGCGGAGGCRHWEKCTNNACRDTTNLRKQPASPDACGDAAFAPIQSTPNPQPTQGNAPTSAAAQPPPAGGSCDNMNWYCLGECANSEARNAFGGNWTEWRRQKAINERQPGACDTVQQQPTQAPNQPTTQPTSPPAGQPTSAVNTPTQSPNQPTSAPVQYGTASCYVSSKPYPAGYCSPTSAGNPYLYCNNTAGLAANTGTYVGWNQDRNSICIQGVNACIGVGFAPGGGFPCCSGKTDTHGKCSTAQSGGPVNPPATVTTAPQQYVAPTATSTPIPPTLTPVKTNTPIPSKTSTPIPTNTSVPAPTNAPTNTPVPLPTSTHTPIPTTTHTPIPTSTHTPIPTTTHTPSPTNTPVPPTSTPIPPTNTPYPPTSTPLFTSTPVPTRAPTSTPVQVATSTPATGVTNVPVAQSLPLTNVLAGIFNAYKSTYPSLELVPVTHSSSYTNKINSAYSDLKSKYGNVIHETPVTSGPISNYLNNYCFVAMTFEDIPESKDVCGTKPYCQFWFIDELETGRCIGGVKRSEASQLNIFKHELCHNEQAQHDPRLAEHTKAAQSKENINKTYQSLVEGYAELACAQVGGSYYAKHRNLYNSLQTWAGQNRQSGNFELAAKGNWSAFCDLREVYGNGNLKALLVNSGWGGIGSDGSDSYSLDQCKGL